MPAWHAGSLNNVDIITRTTCVRVTLFILPGCSQHSEVALATVASVASLTTLCRAYAGSSCSAIERSLERRRRARLPPSGTALLRKRSMKRNRRTAGMSGGQSKE